MKIFLYLIILLFAQNSLAIDYKGLKKIIKNSSFIDKSGSTYKIDKIDNIKKTLLIIFNHGSGQDTKTDKCILNAQYGYTWEGAVVPAILELHNKKINNLTIKIYRLCSGVKGMKGKDQKKIRKEIKKGEKLNLFAEYKNIKRQNIILDKVNEFIELGFENIVLSGHSAGAWASLNLQSRYPDKFKGTIAMNPAFAGPKTEWQKIYPEWGAFRKYEVNLIKQADYLNALIFAHTNDEFEDPETLSFFKEIEGVKFIDFTELDPTTCNWADVDKKMPKGAGHNIDQSECFTKYIEKNNYYIEYLKSLFK